MSGTLRPYGVNVTGDSDGSGHRSGAARCSGACASMYLSTAANSSGSVTPFKSGGCGWARMMNIILATSDRHLFFGRMSGGANLWQGVQISFATFSSSCLTAGD